MASKSVASRHAQLREELQSARPLPRAAREFVEAAKTLVEREGISALTLQRVADADPRRTRTMTSVSTTSCSRPVGCCAIRTVTAVVSISSPSL